MIVSRGLIKPHRLHGPHQARLWYGPWDAYSAGRESHFCGERPILKLYPEEFQRGWIDAETNEP
jgi:hypothetical protein